MWRQGASSCRPGAIKQTEYYLLRKILTLFSVSPYSSGNCLIRDIKAVNIYDIVRDYVITKRRKDGALITRLSVASPVPCRCLDALILSC
jgi:hypothetical protein